MAAAAVEIAEDLRSPHPAAHGQDRRRQVLHHGAGDRIGYLERLLETGLEPLDHDQIAQRRPCQQLLLTGDPQLIQRPRAGFRQSTAKPARPANIRIVPAHRVDDAVSADQLLDHQHLRAAERDFPRYLEILKHNRAERECYGH